MQNGHSKHLYLHSSPFYLFLILRAEHGLGKQSVGRWRRHADDSEDAGLQQPHMRPRQGVTRLEAVRGGDLARCRWQWFDHTRNGHGGRLHDGYGAIGGSRHWAGKAHPRLGPARAGAGHGGLTAGAQRGGGPSRNRGGFR